jgi:hypothetical protein
MKKGTRNGRKTFKGTKNRPEDLRWKGMERKKREQELGQT